ncbi:MAG: selenocysteine-specific translation elongation factor [Defluviitaleaceae bacterium]|nr:selenocysteine-specific translation elongation factor [Defluviitaleaceae bacterium]
MNHIIVGTAGHIDHGKTTLIKALTGRNTDRLQEEQRRGISIDLGFTYFDLPSGARAGIIDVPGHERFIKNMLAGASGIDLVLLAVAANEGVKPQTIEHIDILSYLGIKEGLIVLTKASLADETMIELVIDDIREKTAGTFFETAEVIMVDSLSGQGIENLAQRIDSLRERIPPRNTSAPPRLSIDRVFSLKGFGTVVTGTLAEGVISLEEELSVYSTGADEGAKAKIRGIQVHDDHVKAAFAGQRTAINLSNVKPSDLRRGDMLARAGTLNASMYLDVRLNLVRHAERALKFWERVRLYVGAAQVFARVVLLDVESVDPGENAYAQLRLEESLAVKKGDHFVIRRYSPMETIGGGVVLDPCAGRHAKLSEDKLLLLASMETSDAADIEATRKEQANNDQRTKILSLLEAYHAENNMRPGIPKEELRQKLGAKLGTEIKKAEFDAFLITMQGERLADLHDSGLVSLHGFTPSFTPKQAAAKADIEKRLLEAGFSAPSVADITSGGKIYNEVLDALSGIVAVRMEQATVMHSDFYEDAKRRTIEYIREHGSITLAQFRDMVGTSRKYAQLIMEDFDKRRITKFTGDKRVLY